MRVRLGPRGVRWPGRVRERWGLPVFPAFLTTILFALSGVSGSRSARLVGGTEANFWRLIVATMLLALYAYTLGSGLNGVAMPYLFLSGCIGFGIGDATYFQALPRIGARLSSTMVLCLSAPLAAVVEWWWLGVALHRAEIVAGVVILIGVALALMPGGLLHIPQRALAVGTGYGLIAALCQAGGALLSRKAYAVTAAAAESIDGVTAAYQRILGGVLIMVMVLLWAKRGALVRLAQRRGAAPDGLAGRKARWRKAWPWIVLNGLAGPALGVSCFQWALQLAPSGVVLPIVSVTPIVIIPFAWYIEGERPTVRSLAGGAVAVLGAVALAFAR